MIESMPRNTHGKIDRKAVRERYWEGQRKVCRARRPPRVIGMTSKPLCRWYPERQA